MSHVFASDKSYQQNRDNLNALIKTLFAWVDGLYIKIPSTQQTPMYLLYHEIIPSITCVWTTLELYWVHSENYRLQN